VDEGAAWNPALHRMRQGHIGERRPLEGMTMRGFDIMSAVMTAVQIAGLAVTTVVLNRFTPLPFWACCVLGFPLFWAVFIGVIWVLGRKSRG